jgi:hypothetical protein
MATSATNLVTRLASHLANIEHSRRKVETLFGDRVLVRRDVELVYRGMFLEAVTAFEGFLEALFVGLVCKATSHPCRKVKPKVFFNSRAVCHSVIQGKMPYADWMPFENTVKRANAYLHLGLPFTSLSKDKRRKLEKISIIRNAIAHQSRQAERRFHSEVLTGLNLLSHETTPAGFLRSVFAVNPSQTRYEEYIFDLVSLARQMVSGKLAKQ